MGPVVGPGGAQCVSPLAAVTLDTTGVNPALCGAAFLAGWFGHLFISLLFYFIYFTFDIFIECLGSQDTILVIMNEGHM